jgi:uncharacterized protein YbjT (DUF2867 family)
MQIPAYADAFVAAAVENVVNALEATRVKSAIIKMANPSSVEATPDSGFSANAIVLNGMRSSAIPFSVVEPTMYLDTFLKPNFRREISRHNTIDLPIADDLRIAWTTVDDAARLAVCQLQSKTWGQTLRCAGETAYSGHELAAAFSTALGRHISYRSTGLDAFQRDIESAIGAAAAAPVISKFRFLARLPEEAGRMLGVAAKVPSLQRTFAPTRLHDWICMNSASFSQGA